MTTGSLFEAASERLVLDVSWFLLLCLIFGLLRFHKWRKEPKLGLRCAEPDGAPPKTSVSDKLKKAA
jgi:hypothetical protein